MRRLLLCALLAASCAGAPPKPPPAAPAAPAAAQPAPGAQETLDFAREPGVENGRLTSPEQSLAGPLVLTYLSPGAELEISTAATSGRIGRVTGPLAQPFHVAAGSVVRLAAPGDAVYAGYRPAARMTHTLDAWLGRKILVSLVGAPAEEWSLRELAGDHVTLERSRTFRVVPVRRIAEITWTDLTGADPRPHLVLAPE